MNKRNVATVLWFLAGWSGGGLVVGLTGMPALLAFVPGILLAGWVRWDTRGVLWTRSVTGRRIVPINQLAAELEYKAGASGTVAREDTSAR
jgi:hypothetical protein